MAWLDPKEFLRRSAEKPTVAESPESSFIKGEKCLRCRSRGIYEDAKKKWIFRGWVVEESSHPCIYSVIADEFRDT